MKEKMKEKVVAAARIVLAVSVIVLFAPIIIPMLAFFWFTFKGLPEDTEL